MERLTFNGDFCDIAQCLETRGGGYCPDGYCSQRRVWERLREYEDIGLTPEEVTDLLAAHGTAIGQLAEYRAFASITHLRELVQAEKNEPLTLDELWGMDGEPVWLVSTGEDFDDGWYIIVKIDKKRLHCLQLYAMLFFEYYGKTWIAYRHKPKEGL